MLNLGLIPGPAYERVGVGARVGVAVGGRGVLVGVRLGNWPGGVVVGLLQAGGKVCVGNTTGIDVTVGLNNAVIVRSGVGNTKGVGEATNGKLQANTINPNVPSAIST